MFNHFLHLATIMAGLRHAQQTRIVDVAVFQFFSLVFKFATASILVGAGLTAMNLDANRLLDHAGVTPEQLVEMSETATQWLVPNMTLGAVIVLPLWLLASVLRPPRNR